MAKAILIFLFPFAQAFVAPASPCMPKFPQLRRAKDVRPRMPLDPLMFESGLRNIRVPGYVHRLLDRREWTSQLAALERVLKGKSGLQKAGTWIEGEIMLQSEVLAWARRTSNVIHFGNLFTLSGKLSKRAGFWSSLLKQVELEPCAPLTRIFDRNHRLVLYHGQAAIALETEDFAKQCVDSYESLVGSSVKHQRTSRVDPGALSPRDNVARGSLADSAARILMKILKLARLNRPDLMVAVTTLTTNVCRWSVNDDKRVARLVGSIAATVQHNPVTLVHDPASSLHLALYVDSDFGGCIDTARSTSGYIVALEGSNSFVLLSWSSKRQKVVSRSPPEAEFVSLSSALFNDALPLLEVWQTVIPGIKLLCHANNEACIAILRKGYSAQLRKVIL